MWLLYWNSAKGSSPSQSSCLWLIKTRRYCSNSWLTRSVDRLVQPLPYETLIFSHFTHFTLRSNSDPTPSTPFELRRNSDRATSFPVTRRDPPTFPEFHRVLLHHHRDHQNHLVIIRYIFITVRQPSPTRSRSVSSLGIRVLFYSHVFPVLFYS